MNEQNPTPEEIQSATEFLQSRGRRVEAIPGDRVGYYRVDGRTSTARDVLRHAIAAGLFSDKSARRRG